MLGSCYFRHFDMVFEHYNPHIFFTYGYNIFTKLNIKRNVYQINVSLTYQNAMHRKLQQLHLVHLAHLKGYVCLKWKHLLDKTDCDSHKREVRKWTFTQLIILITEGKNQKHNIFVCHRIHSYHIFIFRAGHFKSYT